MLLFWTLPQSGSTDDADSKQSKLARLDVAGAITLVGAVLTGLLALDLASKSFSISCVGFLAAAFALFVALFITVEKHYAEDPVVPLDLISDRDVITSYLIVALQSAGQFGVCNLGIICCI